MASTSKIGARPGRPKDPERRHAILVQAASAFAETGYAGTSLSAVAARVGSSKSALLHHFPSKEALYFSVLGSFVTDLGTLIAQAHVNEGPFPDRLDRLGSLVVEYCGSHPEAAKLLVSELIGRGPFARGPGAKLVQTTMQTVVGFLQAGMDAGAFRRQDPMQLAMSITGLHLIYFAAHEVSEGLAEADPFSPEMLEERRTAILAQVRALCLA